MEINKAKSGILPFFQKLDRKEHLGYPIVNQYKYLGMILNSNLEIGPHLKQINAKFGFICSKLLTLRSRQNLKINRNLFITFIAPLYRLAFTLSPTGSKNDI
jgi:hypothetical protein